MEGCGPEQRTVKNTGTSRSQKGWSGFSPGASQGASPVDT